MHKLVIAAALGLLLAGCSNSNEADDLAQIEAAEAASGAATDAGAAPAGATSAAPTNVVAMPVTVAADAIAVGGAIGPNGAVNSVKPAYSTADTVYASAPTRGHPAGASVSIYWTYQDGLSHKEERKKLETGAEYVNFKFAKADGMKPGRYNAQIDVNDTPIGIVDFTVK